MCLSFTSDDPVTANAAGVTNTRHTRTTMTTPTTRSLFPRANYPRSIRTLSYLLFLATTQTTALPTPTFTQPQTQMESNIIPTLRCACLTFPSFSPATPCTLSGTQNLDWDTTERLARLHGLPITFASPETASKVLDAPVPLSTTLLMNMDLRPEYPASEGAQPTGTMMVCGAGDEVGRTVLREERLTARVETQEQRVSGVLAAIVLAIILWALGECLWDRYFGRIQLRGGEKSLAVGHSYNHATDEKAIEKERALEHDEFPDSPWGP